VLSSTNLPDIVGARPDALVGLDGEFQSRYLYIDGEHDLSIWTKAVNRRQAQAVREREAEFALMVEEPLIVFCARFGDQIPWTASFYSWHLVPRNRRTLPPRPEAPDERRAFVSISLATLENGPAKATRNVTLSLDFTRALNVAIREQAKLSFTNQSYQRALSSLGRRYPAAADLAARATIRTSGSL
jgi:hypothetical protein